MDSWADTSPTGKLRYRTNRKSYSQNLTNYQNPTRPGYNTWTNEITYGYNTSIIPVISYTIDF